MPLEIVLHNGLRNVFFARIPDIDKKRQEQLICFLNDFVNAKTNNEDKSPGKLKLYEVFQELSQIGLYHSFRHTELVAELRKRFMDIHLFANPDWGSNRELKGP